MSFNIAALKGMGNYSSAALEGMGNYSSAALEGMGNYSSAALEGMGSYSKAALKGMGKKKLVKGSAEAKKFMAYLRSLRGKKITKGGKRCMRGRGPIGDVIGNSLGYWTNYFGDWHTLRKAQLAEIERLKKKRDELKKQRGGKIDKNTVRDIFLGPVGWIHAGMTKKRQREIEQLKKEVGEW